MRLAILLTLCCGCLAKPFPGCRGSTLEGCPGTANCTEKYFEQVIDHFNWAPPLGGTKTTYKQRYFVNEQWWKPGGPIFFYLGNEDNVELYVNHTGLMWENAEEFNALLIFAEHRYYGKSSVFPDGTSGCMSWLTTEQALADFAFLIDDLQDQYGDGSRLPILGFGGSYGGMMASWFRIKYPQSVDGVIAASAPIWSFDKMDPPYDFNAYYQGVTFDASTAGGASDKCKDNLKKAWPIIVQAGQTVAGRATLTQTFRTCRAVSSEAEAQQIIQWAEQPWANMAMGNFPYASTYLMHGKSFLPPWPVRAACKHLECDFTDDASLFAAVREAVATQYNNTGDKTCFDIYQYDDTSDFMRGARRADTVRATSTACTGTWDYQYCTEMTQPFTQGTAKDFYYCAPGVNCSYWNFDGVAQNCETQWGVRPRRDWTRIGLSSKRLHSASNIVFSNGLLDPWHAGGVLQNVSDTVRAIIIPHGAHHVDLMFSDPVDKEYPDIIWAREYERTYMHKFIAAASQQPKLAVTIV